MVWTDKNKLNNGRKKWFICLNNKLYLKPRIVQVKIGVEFNKHNMKKLLLT